MPDRIIRESVCSSDDLDRLTPFEEIVFYRLIVNCDDYGRLDARPNYLRSKLFVTRKNVTERSIEEALSKLASLGLVQLYTVEERTYLAFTKWEKHQRIRAKRSRWPSPEDGQHMPADAVAGRRNPIRSESESQSESESEINPPGAGRRDEFSAFTQNRELRAALRAFEEMRVKIKKPLTGRAKELLLLDLKRLAEDPETQILILEQSIKNSWQGVFAPKTTAGSPKTEGNPFDEIIRREKNAEVGNGSHTQRGVRKLPQSDQVP